MKGDFSRLRFPGPNINGILPQQGRVLLDSDGIAQTLAENAWHHTAARDLMGPGASVAADAAASFEITGATWDGTTVSLAVNTGHLWADGMLVELESPTGSLTRTATWLDPPLVPLAGGTVNAGDSDAVVLEVWQHALSAFQVPNALIEPALGGPDTAERLQTSFAFRLVRLAAGEGCDSLTFDESGRGALTVALAPPVTITGDCPVQGAGGYSGYEHQLYRIEIADTNTPGTSRFKWSRSNAGLAGRGNYTPGPNPQIDLTANLAAITSARQTSFYLEIETYDTLLGYSHVTTGGWVTLAGSTLTCGALGLGAAWPAAAGSVFFRLWDGFEPVGSYTAAGGTPLENGILLQFDPDAAGKYFPGDYWTFPVRAQGIANPQTLINARQPQGIVYRRVALAEISWMGGSPLTGAIEDCRTIMPPLSRAKGCCTYRVGDGVTSFGDFNTIQAAVDALPHQGGEICLLPGRHHGPVLISKKLDVVIHGCGWQTRVASAPARPPSGMTPPLNPFQAVFTIVNSLHVKFASFCIEAADTEVGVLIGGPAAKQTFEAVEFAARVNIPTLGTIDVTLEDLVLTGALLPAVLALNVELLRIIRNRVAMKSSRLEAVQPFQWPAIFASGQEIHIERNWIGLQSAAAIREYLPYTVIADLGLTSALNPNPNIGGGMPLHPGGIQIGGPSSDVYILENEIDSGSRNGITLGSLLLLDGNGNDTGTVTGTGGDGEDCCPPTFIPPDGGGGGHYVSAGALVNIHIHRNRIRDMGMCGIGPVAFFDPRVVREVISIISLHISQNEISRTLRRVPGPMPGRGFTWIGYGAVCVPDVRDLVIHDNAITDFGAQPGDSVCGIFILHGELIDISRNQIVETRDWLDTSKSVQPPGGPRGGIFVAAVTPPSAAQPLITATWGTTTPPPVPVMSSASYAPGMPAARVAENLVRVPQNYGLLLWGWGAFEIPDNHFACGGQVEALGIPLAETVLIFNLGTPIDRATKAQTPSGSIGGGRPTKGGNAPGVPSIAPGTVLFTGNVCQLDAKHSGQQGRTSVLIFTLDQLTFSSNHSSVDGVQYTALLNALLVGETLNIIGNRFQEAPLTVAASVLTFGVVNITGQNISSNALVAVGTLGAATNNNLVVP